MTLLKIHPEKQPHIHESLFVGASPLAMVVNDYA